MKVKFEFALEVSVKKEGKWYIASCNALDVHSQGMTEAKSIRNLIEALTLFVESCWERGTLEEVLKISGFKPVPISRLERGKSSQHIVNIPLPLASDQHAPAHAH